MTENKHAPDLKAQVVPIHQWTNGGSEVLLLKCVGKDGVTHNGFKWPLEVGSIVTAPDWNPKPCCGGGLHAWPWGLSPGAGKDPTWDTPWLVLAAKPEDVVAITDDGGGKAKTSACRIVFVGDWQSATNHILTGQIAWVQQAASGAASATGERGAASATGESGAASATGERGAASATGWSGAASATGIASAAVVTGTNGKAKAGEYGCIALAWWNDSANRTEMRCARTGPGDRLLKPHTWYRLNKHGKFEEAE